VKTVLIISAHFPPVNAPDLHRVRQSLMYFEQYGITPVVLAVDPKFVENSKDELLLRTIPSEIKVYYSNAISQKFTRLFGYGNLDFRAFFHIFFLGNKLIKKHKVDAVYFSTRSHYIMPLGRIWKFLFKVPYIVDIHDPWFEKDALNRPKEERLPKHKLAYFTNKVTESFVMKKADGIITVSDGILEDLKSRYPRFNKLPSQTISFGAFAKDFEFEDTYLLPWSRLNDEIVISYIGAYAPYMKRHFEILFKAVNIGMQRNPELFKRIRIFCIGTSYSNLSNADKKLEFLAEQCGVKDFVKEETLRVPYFESVFLMKKSNILFLPGSKDKNYSASKIYNYVLANHPILTIQHRESDLIQFFDNIRYGYYLVDNEEISALIDETIAFIEKFGNSNEKTLIDKDVFKKYSAEVQTGKQANLLLAIIQKRK